MTETRLRTYSHLAAYSLALVFLASLAAQNLRYGFYDLFFLATVLLVVMISGVTYTLFSRRHQLKAQGHSFILLTANLLLATCMLTLDQRDLSYWAMPILLLNMIILPLRRGLVFSLPVICTLLLNHLLFNSAGSVVSLSVAVVFLLSAAVLYSWHYDHMAQSAEDLTIFDPLTGAHNARFLQETLQKEISRSAAMNHPLSVILLRIDYLEETMGLHGEAGLQTLHTDLANKLFELIRAGDTLYTLSEGSFFLILPFTPEEGVRVIAERIRRIVAEEKWPVVGRMTVSGGCTTRTAQDLRAEQLLKRSENALEEACRGGHNRLWFSAGNRSNT